MIANIAFVGGAGAGKTTAAQVLVDRFPDLGFQRISFAEPLKAGLGTETDRRRMQEFGTDVVRRYDDQFWVRLFLWNLKQKQALRRARAGHDDAHLQLSGLDHLRAGRDRPLRWVNDDCRFANELAVLLDHGWWILEVQADLQIRIDRLTRNGKLTDPAQLEHASEKSLGALVPHGILVNNGTEDELAEKIAAMLKVLGRRS